MASYPGPKVHRVNRRKLGRGQFPSATGVAVTITASGSTATLTFARPVVVTGPIPLTVGGVTPVSQTIVSPTVVTITYSGTITSATYSLPAGAVNVATYQGGQVFGAAGTF
jgi:hypothetical protein